MNSFHEGGWGMYPTTVFGVLMVGAAIAYAIRPVRRFVPLQISLGILTLFGGSLGFVTGMIKSLDAIGQVGPDQRFIWLIGMGESLNNIGLALAFVVLASLLASVGALRLALGFARSDTSAHVIARAE